MIDHASTWLIGVSVRRKPKPRPSVSIGEVKWPDAKAHRDTNRDAHRCINSSKRTPCDPPMVDHVKCPHCVAVSRYGAASVAKHGIRITRDETGAAVQVELMRFRSKDSAA